MMPAMRRIAAVVAVLGLVACSHKAPSATPTPSPAVSTTTAAPSATPSTPPSATPSASATPSPSPAKTGLPQATGPAPAHFSPLDFSFIGSSFGWALGQTCGDTTCTAHVARTTDAGHSWHALPDPGASLDEGSDPAIRFGDQSNGWIYGPHLWSTHDGGRSWKHVAIDGDVVALEELSHTAWAFVRKCAGDAGTGPCTHSLWSAPLGSDTFVRRGAVPAADGNTARWQLVRAGSASGWLSGWGDGGSLILRTTDGGRTWKEIANPCKTQSVYYQRLARYDAQHLWLVCGSDAGAGSQTKVVYRTSDGGTHWGNRNDGPYRGLLHDLFALGATQTALLSTTHSGLLRTNDGGVTWRVVAPDCCDEGFEKIESIDFTHVWAIGRGANAIFYSADRGRTWGHYSFHA